MYNLLSDYDQSLIEDYINSYAYQLYREKRPDINLEYVLRVWSDRKQWLFEKFGNRFIIEKDVEINTQYEAVSYDIESYIESSPFFINLANSMKEKSEDKYNLYFKQITELTDIYENKYHGGTFKLKISPFKNIKVQSGCKLNKLYGKLAKVYEIDGYDEVSNYLSQITNQKTLKGTLCISIHPLDFFTLSDNSSGWSSCLSWQKNGGYSVGPVAAMNDPYVIVGYLKSEKNMDNFDWNSKKWRQLYYVSDNIITDIKQYPYFNEELNNACLDMIKDLFAPRYLFDKYEKIRCYSKCEEGNFTIQSFNTGHLYNDFIRFYNHTVLINRLESAHNFYHISICNDLTCPVCGKYYAPNHEGQRVCSDCEEIVWCDDCGEALYREEAIYKNGTVYCENCYENHLVHCDECNKLIFDDDGFMTIRDTYVCCDCIHKPEE